MKLNTNIQNTLKTKDRAPLHRHKAFTLTEIMVVLILVGVFAALATKVMRSDSAQEELLVQLSRNFFTSVENAAMNMAMDSSLIDTDDDKTITLNEFRNYFTKKLSGIADSLQDDDDDPDTNPSVAVDTNIADVCTLFKAKLNKTLSETSSSGADVSSELVCSRFDNKVLAGFYYNAACDKTFFTKEYYERKSEFDKETDAGESDPRLIEKACGYIVYGFENTMKLQDAKQPVFGFGENIFTVSIGKNGVKYR